MSGVPKRRIHSSLRLRVSLVAAAVIALFALATATVLERAFHDSARDATEARLEAQLLLLLANADVLPSGMVRFPELLPDPRLTLPGSGLFARVLDRSGQLLWRSPSALTLATEAWSDPLWFRHALTVQWEVGDELLPLTFELIEDRNTFQQQIERYRGTLWLGLLLLTLLLILAQALALGFWGLRPLRQVRADLEALRQGEYRELHGRYPREIQELTDSINSLLSFEQTRLERQQNALADLAHSLKTPLSALRLGLDHSPPDGRELGLQVERMQAMIQHELNRAQHLGPAPFQAPVALAPLISRTCNALARLAAGKGISVHTQLDPECRLRMESGAVFELFGNLMDNALRHARTRIAVSLECRPDGLLWRVDDDGPGIPHELREHVLQRGQRLDTRSDGQGLGLHLVDTLVRDHGGQLVITAAPELGGARIELRFPARNRLYSQKSIKGNSTTPS